jgi:CheY-like chemotaxis protein
LVLICDDEPRLATLTAGLLEQSGFAAVTSFRGEEALELLLENPPPDVLLLDVTVSGLTAAQILGHIRQRALHVPVILTSGYAEEDIEPALARDPLVRGYLAKPYSVGRLVQVVQNALSLPPQFRADSGP